MSIVGILANGVSTTTGNNIVGNSATLTHHFVASSIWGHPGLQGFSTQGDNVSNQPGAGVGVSQFVDAHGTHNVDVIGQFASGCTSITYLISAADGGSASALCITEFLD
jgi:hypothetical protein